MLTHELFDRDDPKCLYCNGDVDTGLSSEWIPGASFKVDSETLTCKKCNELFMIHSTQTDDGFTIYDGFTFTCKGLKIFFSYIESYFDISDSKGKHITAVPSFDLDFSDRNKLHEKLKTYIVFS